MYLYSSRMNVGILSLVLCLTLLVSSTGAASGSQQVNYVTPTSPAGISCPGQPCLTLDQYITSSSTYIISNTVFKLLPGIHVITRSFVARNIECITLEGDTERKSNPQVQISSARYLLQFIDTVDVYIVGIELKNVGISFEGTENVTLHQVVVDGPRTAVSLLNTIDTNISCCSLKNTGWTALTLQNTHNTRICNTTVNNTRWNGFDLLNSSKTEILHTFINSTGWNGIELRQTNCTFISCSTVNSTGWNGIEIFNASTTKVTDILVNETRRNGIEIRQANFTVIYCSTVNSTGWNGIEIFNSSQTTVNCSLVNETGWNGIEIRNSTQARVIGTNITNTGRSRLDCRYTDTPCTVETPPNLNCSCKNKDACCSAPLNLLTLQSPECGDETISDDIVTCSKQVNITTPTSSVYERSQSSTYPTPMMSVIQVTPVPSVGIPSPINYSSHRNVILGVSGSVATVMLGFIIVAIVAWIYRKNRNKDVSDEHNKKCHVYEDANPALHHNENPMRMRLEENPAYASTHYYSRS
ncbi:hypothetical protein GBAR_LOCUS11962 [Geodia barretti]|uniref:Right handed beta helix domain-containing protein n=1 Tax=Geodia barretti TaxID=519541 RepID=A0AA35RZA0_GEOBA|nr:hypothetical protein GBAR_LOCUS11962 [Geodia barretti]